MEPDSLDPRPLLLMMGLNSRKPVPCNLQQKKTCDFCPKSWMMSSASSATFSCKVTHKTISWHTKFSQRGKGSWHLGPGKLCSMRTCRSVTSSESRLRWSSRELRPMLTWSQWESYSTPLGRRWGTRPIFLIFISTPTHQGLLTGLTDSMVKVPASASPTRVLEWHDSLPRLTQFVYGYAQT